MEHREIIGVLFKTHREKTRPGIQEHLNRQETFESHMGCDFSQLTQSAAYK